MHWQRRESVGDGHWELQIVMLFRYADSYTSASDTWYAQFLARKANGDNAHRLRGAEPLEPSPI